MTPTLPPELRSTIGRILHEQKHNRVLARKVARGIRSVTESEAYPYLAAALTVLDGQQRTGFIRGCALMIGLTHAPKTSLGRSLAELSHRTAGRWPSENLDGIGAKVQLLPHLELEPAAEVLDGLLRRCERESVAVNVFDLAATLIWWCTEDPLADYKHRNQIVFSYFTPIRPTKREAHS